MCVHCTVIKCIVVMTVHSCAIGVLQTLPAHTNTTQFSSILCFTVTAPQESLRTAVSFNSLVVNSQFNIVTSTIANLLLLHRLFSAYSSSD